MPILVPLQNPMHWWPTLKVFTVERSAAGVTGACSNIEF
jgi:hypothetical protein